MSNQQATREVVTENRTAALQQMRNLSRAALFAALTASGGLLALQMPISTVPFTLQVMFALMSGLLLGAKNGAFSQVIYVTLGLVGLPVFAKGSAGLGVLLGPTGGYLVGFVCAAFVTGLLGTLVRRVALNADWWRISGYILAALLGLFTIYLVGTLRLALSLQISMPRAFAVGVLPFMAADLVKTIAAASFVIALERRGLRPS